MCFVLRTWEDRNVVTILIDRENTIFKSHALQRSRRCHRRLAACSALMGKRRRPWQDADYVLGFFGERPSEARRNLNAHVRKWSAKGRRHELTGGGLIRSDGGWHAVKEAYRAGIRLASDERILGSSEFVEVALKCASEVYERRTRMLLVGHPGRHEPITTFTVSGPICNRNQLVRGTRSTHCHRGKF